MIKQTPPPVDPARVLAGLRVLDWPDDRGETYADVRAETYYHTVEDVIRAADEAREHVMEHRDGRWHIEHPPGCYPGCAADRTAAAAAIDTSVPSMPGRYACRAGEFGDRLAILDRVDQVQG